MTTILGLDLGEFKGLDCFHDPAATEAHFTTDRTDPADQRKLLEAGAPAWSPSRAAPLPAGSPTPAPGWACPP